MKNAGKGVKGSQEEELLRRFRSGEKAAIELLLGRCAERMEQTALAVLGDPDAARQTVEIAAAEARRTMKRFHGKIPLTTQLCALVIAHCRTRKPQK